MTALCTLEFRFMLATEMAFLLPVDTFLAFGEPNPPFPPEASHFLHHHFC